MRGRIRPGRESAAVPARAFGWDRAVLATLQHVSLPWDEPVAAVPLAEARTAGMRDRLSLFAQFSAHEALLQFAGIADGELDAAEWAVVQKRGSDVRLIRVAARACDPSLAPPVLTLAQQFAEQVRVELDVLRESWARADAIYAEAFGRLARDAAVDLRWVRASACGAVAAPGAEGLRMLAYENGTYGYEDEAGLAAMQRFAELEAPFRVVVIRGASPLERYSALAELVEDRSSSVGAVAERIVASTSGQRHLFAVVQEGSFDEGSRQVVELLAKARHGTWLLPRAANPLPARRPFLIAPRLELRSAIQVPYEELVQSPAFAAYLEHGDVPEPKAFLPALAEPARSYVGALALLGARIPREIAAAFLRDFLFTGDVEELVVPGVMTLEDGELRFANDAVRGEAARLIPAGSRANIARVAATHTDGITAALLWLDAGDPETATAVLDRTAWASSDAMVAALRRVPRPVLSPPLLRRYAHALVDCGRYRDARELDSGDELALARAERRMGDYAAALARLEQVNASFDTQLLRAELLRLVRRNSEACAVLDACVPASAQDQVRRDYERAAHGATVALPAEHYLAARLAMHAAVDAGDFAAATEAAIEAHRRARTAIERIDASLDHLFVRFTAGEWDAARAVAIEALREVEETQGDRGAGGILFFLAYLAADDGQWAHAAQRIARQRQYYAKTGDAVRLRDLQLLTAHLDFSRGRFSDARQAAEAVYSGRGEHDQIREAAALILDELDRMDAKNTPLRSTGTSGNIELTRRHARLRDRWQEAEGSSVPAKLVRFRAAIANGDRVLAAALAAELDLVLDAPPAPSDAELRILRAAATRTFPFAPHDFDVPWCFATRNRLGQWNTIGSRSASSAELDAQSLEESSDWIVCSERELLFLEGASRWSGDARDSVAALFRARAENHRLSRVREQEESVRPGRASAAGSGILGGIIGQSPAIREIETIVERVARRDVAVCVLGESGTGKELIARAIHRQSARRQKPFTPVNCAALPENLIESELFGHVRGAFTGADRDRAGLIETTDGGTLFLDEVGELPLPAQAKLLRFLQEGEFRRVGDTVNRSADVRVVSATNRKLDLAVEEGRFRDDLYYRVRGVEVLLPPLRERGSDVVLLASHFLAAEREKHRSGPEALSEEVAAIFTTYSWPGNVRELQNTIRAAHAMAGEGKEIEIEHLPERLRNVVPSRVPAGSYQHAVTSFRRDLVQRALTAANGNQNRAATALKMSRQALAYQIRELGILVRPRA